MKFILTLAFAAFSFNAFATLPANPGCTKNANNATVSDRSPEESVRVADLVTQKRSAPQTTKKASGSPTSTR